METFAIPPQVKALIFDCDGTIADTMPVHFKAYEEALGRDAHFFSEKMFYDQAGVPAVEVMRILKEENNLNFDPEKIAHHKESLYGEMLKDGVRAIPAVEAIIRKYAGQYPMAVASGGTRDNVENTLKIIGLAHFFEASVTAEDVTHGKPAPDIFLEAAKKLGVAPNECLVFEDGEMGFEAAKAAGMIYQDVRPWYGMDRD